MCKLPTGTHENTLATWCRSSAVFDMSAKNTPAVTTKEPPSMVVAR